jgi:aspartyl-tRNA(Asn)/glutamyl-tRNA(Gln) amidotransferase subunit A
MPTDPVEIYLSDIFTVLANLTGMPAITLNVKNSDKENGLAFQIMVKQGEDWKLLQIAKQILEKQSPAV